MLADPSFGQDVSKPIGNEHLVWDLHPASGELDTQGVGDGSLRNGRMKALARGGWGLAVLNEDMKATAKLHGPLPDLHQDITQAGERSLSKEAPFSKDSLIVQRHRRKGSPDLRADLATDLGAHGRDRSTSHSCELGEGSGDNAAAGERAGGRAGEERLGSTPVCRTVRTELSCMGFFPGLVGQVLGSHSRIRETQRLERRGAQGAGAAAHAALEACGVPTRTAA